MNNNMIVNSIKNLCKNNNITVSQLEKEIGLSQGLVSKWMNTTPSLDKIVDIANYFHVSLDEVVGYDHSLNDDFIRELYERTGNGSVSWKLVKKTDSAEFPKIKLYNKWEDELPPDNYYNEETHKEIHYIIRFDKGYIIMYAFYQNGCILNPEEIKLFIQPTYDSYLVEQNYSFDNLLKLWIKILNSLGDEAPDAIKAEDLKNGFILNKSFTNKASKTSNETDLSNIERVINDPSILKLIETCNKPEFQQLQKTFSSPEFQKTMQVVNKLQKYFDSL